MYRSQITQQPNQIPPNLTQKTYVYQQRVNMATKATSTISKSGAIFFSSLCASTFGLGCWQAKRYFEKVELVEERIQQLAQDPLTLIQNAKCTLEERKAMLHHLAKESLSSTTTTTIKENLKEEEEEEDGLDLGYRPLMVQGVFRHEDAVLVGPRGPPLGAISSSGPNSGRSSGGMSSSPQGYFLITPLDRNDKKGTILVNRGWIPMHLVKKQKTHSNDNTNKNNINNGNNSHEIPTPWLEPKGIVTVIGVQSKTEQPKFMSPIHDDKKNPRQLLWFDRDAIETKTHTKGLYPLLMTETLEEENTSVPIKPSKQSVGEFKVTPSTHAGYALTWFGLSGAGMVMTRKLLTKGR